ncbi:MAG: HK97 family phage prohead protease, partial [Methylococcales bacterium]
MKIYSRFEVKSIDSENRIVTGMATTPSTDQAGDVVEPNGAEFSLPLPFLWQHDSNYPIGEVISAVKSPKGIEIKAKIAKALDPESLRNKLDEAWGMIKIGLVKGLSIGFAPVDWVMFKDGGVHYKKWRWYELSAVTVPTNVEATITAIKKFDHIPGVASYAVNLTNKSNTLSGDAVDHPKGKNMTIEEQIKDFEAVQHTKSVRMNEIMQKSGAEGRTLDVSESEEYDELQTEITSVGEHLRRLTDLRNIQIRKSTPVAGMTTKEASDARGGQIISHVPQKLEKGIEFARYVQCLG